MKKWLAIIVINVLGYIPLQAQVPSFLNGTWKQEGKNLYEHWDILQDGSLKGFSYQLSTDGSMQISEYLNLFQKGKTLIYEATVINQNQGKAIEFEGSVDKDVYSFVNVEHDFPSVISYQKIHQDSLAIRVSGGERQFSYRMIRVQPNSPQASSSSAYDEDLAKRLGADAYGMKNYYLVILKTGNNKTSDKEYINQQFRGHMDNIGKLVKSGNLVVAGPFGKNDSQFRGIFILQNVNNEAEAKALVENDPAVKAGLLTYSLYPWYGSAALPMYLPYSEKISKENP